jgi:predicted GNAT family acetyltransferase
MVLVRNGECVSKAGLNAQLPNIVQVGGVYTPPELRGQGLAKRVVALMLEQARARGVQQATLFAASDVAARAYIAIGFERVGDWNLTLFKGEQFARF